MVGLTSGTCIERDIGNVMSRRGVVFGVGASVLGQALFGCAPNTLTGTSGQLLSSKPDQIERLKAIAARVLVAPISTKKWAVASSQNESLAALADGASVDIYTGVLDICQTDGHIGAVIAHRVALFEELGGPSISVAMAAPLNAPAQDRQSAQAILKADLAAIAALARAGYDPRDAREIWQLIGVWSPYRDLGFLPQEQRLAAMARELGRLGYQV